MYRLEAPEPAPRHRGATGVRLVRRRFLTASAGALGALLLGCRSRASLAEPAPPLSPSLPTLPPSRVIPPAASFDEFVTTTLAHAEELFAGALDEEEYLLEVIAALEHTDLATRPTRESLPRRTNFAIHEFELADGSGFPWHDHRHYNGVIFVLDGHARIQSGDVVTGDPLCPPGSRVEIEIGEPAVHARGAACSLASTRDNLHDVRGTNGGCRVMDVFTFLAPGARSVSLDVDEAPLADRPNRRSARFRG